MAICSNHRKDLLFRCTAEKYNQTLPAVFLTKILNHFEHFYYDKFQVSKWISFGRQFLKWHQQILIITTMNSFFFSNTMNLHQIHISYRIWNWTTHEPWISLFGNHFRVENIFGKNIHLLTTLRQIIHETKDFGIDFVIHNALKKNKTDFSLFILFRKMKALPCTDFLENLWNDSHTKSFFGEQ